MVNVIEIKNLTKTYGKARGVSGINLDIPAGTIFGFLGPNGAGKSTTISLLVNLIKPTSGTIRVFGKESVTNGLEIRRRVGYLTSDMVMDGHLTGWQQLEYFGRLRGNTDKAYVHELAGRLDCNLDRKQKTLSRGNRQKVGLIAALMHKPELLVLDEPTSGLDPLVQAEFNKIIFEHKAAGNTTFISSHMLSEIQELCDHVAFIREGRLVANTTVAGLAKAAPKRVRVTSGDAKLPAVIKQLKGATSLQAHHHVLEFAYQGEAKLLLGALAQANVTDICIENADLESIFMTFYEEESRHA